MSTESKVFPLRLPPHFHGVQRPFRRLIEIEREKEKESGNNPEYNMKSISNWRVKRLDRDVVRERRQFLVHPAKISQDTPDWFKTTFHHFHRGNQPLRQTEIKGRPDVFNRIKEDPFLQSSEVQNASRLRYSERVVTGKIGVQETHYGTQRWSQHRGSVAPKVGSVDWRDYSVPKPLLKIGQVYENNFVNTYSIA